MKNLTMFTRIPLQRASVGLAVVVSACVLAICPSLLSPVEGKASGVGEKHATTNDFLQEGQTWRR